MRKLIKLLAIIIVIIASGIIAVEFLSIAGKIDLPGNWRGDLGFYGLPASFLVVGVGIFAFCRKVKAKIWGRK